MFGMNFTGHPDRRRILMPEDWQGFPQRKDYPLEGPGRAADGESARLAEAAPGAGKRRRSNRWHDTQTVHHGAMFDTNELVINMGPQHPSTHGVLRVVLRLDGEKVVDADVVIGYLHRGIEKLSENRNWTQIILLTDRMDYVAAATNNVGYCETVEKLMSIEVPRRARYVRTILCELQRIASHCLWLGTHAMDIGAMTVFLYAFRERELILDLFEEFCGARLTYNSMRIGGLPLDMPPGWDKKVLEFCEIMDSKIDEYEELLTHNRIWLERTKGIGVISGPRGGRARPERPAAARLGRAARRPQGRAVRRLRRDGVRRADRHRRRHLRSVSGADGGVPPVAPHHPPGDRGASRRADRRQGAAPDQAAGGRDLSRDRVAEGRARLLHRQRRQVDQPVPVPRAAAVVLQPAGAARGWSAAI